MRRPSVLLPLVLVSACAACSPGAGASDAGVDAAPETDGGLDTTAVQLDDVSVLYPLTATDFDHYLAADAAARGGSLLPEALYDGTLPAPTADMSYASLRVVAFRLDPCFAQIGPITDPSTCQAQIRLVFQPVALADGGATAVDGAVHAFYSLTADELFAAVREVVALRLANGGDRDLGPLAVHPILRSQGVGGAMGQGLDALVTKLAGAANLTRFTVMRSASVFGPSGPGEDRFWNFHGYDVANGATTAMAMPSLPAGSTQVNFSGSTLPLNGVFNPATTSSDDMQLMANTGMFDAASQATQKSAFQAALRIENPNISSANTVDCASCHLARPARDLVAAPLGFSPAGDPNAFVADPRYVPAADMQTTTENGGVELNVHAFSYRDDQAMINQRVINESAAVVAYLNARQSP